MQLPVCCCCCVGHLLLYHCLADLGASYLSLPDYLLHWSLPEYGAPGMVGLAGGLPDVCWVHVLWVSPIYYLLRNYYCVAQPLPAYIGMCS